MFTFKHWPGFDFTLFSPCFSPRPITVRVSSATPRFFFLAWSQWVHHQACAWSLLCLATSFLMSTPFGTICKYNYFVCSCNFFNTKRIAMDVVNKETLELHEGKCQLRLQKSREQRRARIAPEAKEQRERKLRLHREQKGVSKVVGLKKKARKHKSDSNPSSSEMSVSNNRTKVPQAAGSKRR